jgi:site-specific DNA-methyltransferase (adenine-specific)
MLASGFYNMDCMEGMAQFPDKYFELAIVDPPYGQSCDINSNGNRCATRNGFSDMYLNHTSGKWNEKPTDEYFQELFRVSQNQIIWGGNHFQLPPTAGLIVWNKMQRNFSFGDGELAWCSIGNSMRIFDLSRGEMQQENRIHITQKPVKLYEWLLMNYAKQGDKILDTHVGSASSLIACHNMGFEYWGFELDEDYYKAANERLNAVKAQMKLW